MLYSTAIYRNPSILESWKKGKRDNRTIMCYQIINNYLTICPHLAIQFSTRELSKICKTTTPTTEATKQAGVDLSTQTSQRKSYLNSYCNITVTFVYVAYSLRPSDAVSVGHNCFRKLVIPLHQAIIWTNADWYFIRYPRWWMETLKKN